MAWQIEKMTLRDQPAVMDMMRVFYASNAVFSSGSEEIFENDVKACTGNTPFAEGYVFKDGEAYLGYAMLSKSYSTEFGKPCIWIEDLYIQPPYRSMGIGKAFFDFLFSAYRDVVFRLESEKENVRAVALYEKRGFEVLPYLEMIKH